MISQITNKGNIQVEEVNNWGQYLPIILETSVALDSVMSFTIYAFITSSSIHAAMEFKPDEIVLKYYK